MYAAVFYISTRDCFQDRIVSRTRNAVFSVWSKFSLGPWVLIFVELLLAFSSSVSLYRCEEFQSQMLGSWGYGTRLQASKTLIKSMIKTILKG
jgi:hypothetical protein